MAARTLAARRVRSCCISRMSSASFAARRWAASRIFSALISASPIRTSASLTAVRLRSSLSFWAVVSVSWRIASLAASSSTRASSSGHLLAQALGLAERPPRSPRRPCRRKASTSSAVVARETAREGVVPDVEGCDAHAVLRGRFTSCASRSTEPAGILRTCELRGPRPRLAAAQLAARGGGHGVARWRRAKPSASRRARPARVVPPGRAHLLAQLGRGAVALEGELGGAVDGLDGEARRGLARQPRPLPGVGERLEEERRRRPGRCPRAPSRRRAAASLGASQVMPTLSKRARRQREVVAAWRAALPQIAGGARPHQRRRVRHGADDARACGREPRLEARERDARGDRDPQRGVRVALRPPQVAPAPAATTSGFTASTTIAAAAHDLGVVRAGRDAELPRPGARRRAASDVRARRMSAGATPAARGRPPGLPPWRRRR